MNRPSCTVFLCCALACGAAEAQLLPGFTFNSRQFTIEQLSETHLRLTGEVEIEDVGGWEFYADQVDLYSDTSQLVAVGNVVYAADGSRVAADRVEFNTVRLTGTFHNAVGSIVLGEDIERSMFGTQEPDMHFYGETIEKLGPRTYRLTKGGFTSCVQPTPRWQMTASSVTLNLDEYAILRNSVLEVKGVPVFYLPVLYYPIQEDDRATGFLMPMYGASTFRGQSFSNAFFWALGRSHDATFFHDWFTQTGQGQGAEYRYMLGRSSQGRMRTYLLNERQTVGSQGGVDMNTPERRSYELRGNARHRISQNLNARGEIDFFSNITVQQTYHNNIFEASSRERRLNGNIAGSWGLYQVSGTYEATETFFGDREATLWGGGPRVSFGQGQREVSGTTLLLFVQFRVCASLAEIHLRSGWRRDHDRLRPQSVRRQPGVADSVHAVAVPHGELIGGMAGNLLDREYRPRHHHAGADGDLTRVFRSEVSDHWTELREGVGHTGQRVCRTYEACARAVGQSPARHGSGRLRSHRPFGGDRLDPWWGHPSQLWHQQPPLRQTVCGWRRRDRAGDPECRHHAELLHRRARSSIR